MNILRAGFLLLIGTGTLVAGEVSTAFRTLLAGARSVRILAVPRDKGEEATVVVYSDAVEVSRIVSAFDFIDPKPVRRSDGSVGYPGPCKCLPTHCFTFVLRDGSELPLFLDADKDMGVDVQKEYTQRLKMPWDTTLGLTPDSAKSVFTLLQTLQKKEANQPPQPTPTSRRG